MFWRRCPIGSLLITLGIGIVAAICLPPHFLVVVLGGIIIWAGFQLLCK